MRRVLAAVGVALGAACSSPPSSADSADSTAVDTGEFPLRVGNWHPNDWSVQAVIEGQARVRAGELQAEGDEIAVRYFNWCYQTEDCPLASIRLLLTRDGPTNFTTRAASEAIAIAPSPRRKEVWRSGGQMLRLKLPAELPRDGVRLKLDVVYVNGSSADPAGPNLQLQQVLAAANGRPNPCHAIEVRANAVRAGCRERFEILLTGGPLLPERWAETRAAFGAVLAQFTGKKDEPPPSSTEDRLLILALRHEFWGSVPLVLQAGARPDARDPDNPQVSAVMMAAEFDRLDVLEALLAAGGNPDLRTTNDFGQQVRPLTRALRGDSPAALARLLPAAASVASTDPTGWTPMHVAAFESASRSLPLRVRAGADVNEVGSNPRGHTPLMTAIQHGEAATVQGLLALGADPLRTDKEGRNACGWAGRDARDPAVAAAVCR